MSKLAEEFKSDGLAVLAVNAWDEDKGTVSQYAKDTKLKQTFLLEGSGVKDAYGVGPIPTVFWIDRAGKVVDIEIGFESAAALRDRTVSLVRPGK